MNYFRSLKSFCQVRFVAFEKGFEDIIIEGSCRKGLRRVRANNTRRKWRFRLCSFQIEWAFQGESTRCVGEECDRSMKVKSCRKNSEATWKSTMRFFHNDIENWNLLRHSEFIDFHLFQLLLSIIDIVGELFGRWTWLKLKDLKRTWKMSFEQFTDKIYALFYCLV